jgi:hypothetical protein
MITVRVASYKDFAAVVGLHSLLVLHEVGEEVVSSDQVSESCWFARSAWISTALVDSLNWLFLLAEDDGIPIGLLVVSRNRLIGIDESPTFQINVMYVKNSHRGGPAAGLLLREAMRVSRRLGVQTWQWLAYNGGGMVERWLRSAKAVATVFQVELNDAGRIHAAEESPQGLREGGQDP